MNKILQVCHLVNSRIGGTSVSAAKSALKYAKATMKDKDIDFANKLLSIQNTSRSDIIKMNSEVAKLKLWSKFKFLKVLDTETKLKELEISFKPDNNTVGNTQHCISEKTSSNQLFNKYTEEPIADESKESLAKFTKDLVFTTSDEQETGSESASSNYAELDFSTHSNTETIERAPESTLCDEIICPDRSGGKQETSAAINAKPDMNKHFSDRLAALEKIARQVSINRKETMPLALLGIAD